MYGLTHLYRLSSTGAEVGESTVNMKSLNLSGFFASPFVTARLEMASSIFMFTTQLEMASSIFM
jgi:hypothetical protein